MPRQPTLFGRPVPRISSRQASTLLAALAIFAVFSLLFSAPTSIPKASLSGISQHAFSIPKWQSAPSWNPFRAPAHAPPRQKNDTDGDSSWLGDWKWLSIPFSSSYTLDEDRSILPVLVERPPIYCYYDPTQEKDVKAVDAHSELILTWRRAWWAQGFKPIILSRAEAINNPFFQELQRLDVTADLKLDLMRWMAWENMGGGLLSDHLVLPMAANKDPLLTHFRHNEFPKLTKWTGIEEHLLAGPKIDITAAIKVAMQSKQAKALKNVIAILSAEKKEGSITTDAKPSSLAFYDLGNMDKQYPKLGTALKDDKVQGLKSLNQLVNSHLHLTWQGVFSQGIAVLKPLPAHTTTLISNAMTLAKRLQMCSESLMQSSCPPNQPSCKTCVSSMALKISTPAHYRNTTGVFTIGSVPHPYTTQSLANLKDHLDIPWVRRTSIRDQWLAEVTKEHLGTGVGGGPRVLRFKEVVAAEAASSQSIWLDAELPSLPEDDLEWRFGFVVPSQGLETGHSETPVPGPERRPPPPETKHSKLDGPVAKADELKREPALLAASRKVGHSKDKGVMSVRNAVEAWNLADMEAWKFARAFLARERVERRRWAEEEARYADGAGSEKGSRKGVGWGKWLDRT